MAIAATLGLTLFAVVVIGFGFGVLGGLAYVAAKERQHSYYD
jgi:hypothetical protein